MSGRVFILTGEPPDRPGGVEHFVREVMKGAQRQGYSVEVFHRENSLPPWLWSPRTKIGRYVSSNLLGYFIARNARRRMTEDVAAVISNGDLGWCAPRPTGKNGKRIHMYHGTYWGAAEAIRPFITRRGYLYLKWWCSDVLERLGGRNRIVVCNSDQTREEVSRLFGWDGTGVWLPLNLDIFRPVDSPECRRKLGLSQGSPCGLFVGNSSPSKGFDTVRQLMKAFPQVHWIIVLRGDVPPGVETATNVTVLRNVSENDLPRIYNAADFMVCPSLYEPLGYVVAEALACGTPVIASPGGASQAFLTDPPLDRLLVADPKSVEGFVAAAREVLHAPQLYRQKVKELVIPRIVELMSPENWWRKFSEATDL